mmetsp:Transcript_35194/g.79503  ORF Transcript_35194/g.79503 Transcript_35194/m.79503 type:complete len:208 (-) Transcript_35194:262-885(-)
MQGAVDDGRSRDLADRSQAAHVLQRARRHGSAHGDAECRRQEDGFATCKPHKKMHCIDTLRHGAVEIYRPEKECRGDEPLSDKIAKAPLHHCPSQREVEGQDHEQLHREPHLVDNLEEKALMGHICEVEEEPFAGTRFVHHTIRVLRTKFPECKVYQHAHHGDSGNPQQIHAQFCEGVFERATYGSTGNPKERWDKPLPRKGGPPHI